MNEHDVESLLSGLQPRGPSATLSSHVQHELELDDQWLPVAGASKPQRWRVPLGWAAVGAAAAVAIVAVISERPAAPGAAEGGHLAQSQPGSRQTAPVSTIREYVGTRDEGIHYNADSRLPEQHLKVLSLERHAWTDPQDGAQITVEVPREERLILPASFQ